MDQVKSFQVPHAVVEYWNQDMELEEVRQGVEVKVEVGVHHAWNQSNVQFPGHMVAHAVMEHWKLLENKVFSVILL